MLNLNSKLRQKLLLYFFTNPDSKLFLREIARILGVDPTNLSRELKSLCNSGYFLAEQKGNQKYFYLNKDFPLFEEVERIIFKTIGVEGALTEIIAKYPDIKTAFIYGSFANHAHHTASDIDLMVVGKFDEDNFISRINDLEKSLGREINYHQYSNKEWQKKKKEKDSFILNLIEKPKIFLKGNSNEL
jgi:predicted nucleotidyltransferase